MIYVPPTTFTIHTAHAFIVQPHIAPPIVRHIPRPRAKPAPPKPKPYDVYDSAVAASLPAGHAEAAYANGAYAASPAQVPGHHPLWIDASGGDPNANALDVEPGDATPADSAGWVQSHLHAQPHSVAIIYTSRSDWRAVQDSVGSLPWVEQRHVRYWIADPTGVRHVVPGSSATQWYWGKHYDVSTATPDFEH